MSSTWGTEQMPDLKGKTYIITGGSAGLGFEACKELVRRNAHVVLAARSEERGDEAVKNIRKEVGPGGKLDLSLLDLSDFQSVEKFAEGVRTEGYPIHGLLNNAGIFLVEHSKTTDNFEITMKTNYFGPFLLTLLLLDIVKKSSPSRLVWVASPAEGFGTIDWTDLRGLKDSTSDMNMYGRTKLFNIMASNEFNKRLKGTGVESFACHPGVTTTDLYRKMDKDSKLTAKAMDLIQKPFGQSQERGVLSMLMCATEPSLTGQGGKYYGPNTLNLWNTAERGTSSKEADDAAACARLFDETKRILEETVGRPLPGP